MGANDDADRKRFDRGVLYVDLDDWRAFVDYVHESIVPQPDFIWRGQRSAKWDLVSGLDRVFARMSIDSASEKAERMRFQHLQNFRLASRGRLDPADLEDRVFEPMEQTASEEDVQDYLPLGPDRHRRAQNNWWAVGQHHGLVTPLLDWSTSPFVAAFFAFEQATPEGDRSPRRAIYGLHRRLVAQKSDEVREARSAARLTTVMDFVEPLFKDNPRLTSQSGLFTRAPDGVTVQDWVRSAHDPDSKSDVVFLLVVTLPDQDREHILRALNRMNINHQSLFPDLYGATSFVNARLEIESY